MRSFLLLALLTACAQTATPAAAPPRVMSEEAYAHQERVEPYVPYAQRARDFRSRLRVRGPSEAAVAAGPPDGAVATVYPSEVGPLRVWLVRPSPTSASPRPPRPPPIVVVFHNGFSLRPDAVPPLLPLRDAGFALLFPSWRGEDGNPGELELLAGEVRDAKAAVRWAQSLPDLDGRCTYVIGHSIGGGLAALLALHGDVHARLTANVGGIYRAHTFHDWEASPNHRHVVRFDTDDSHEVSMRLLAPNLRDLALSHVSYTGKDDAFDVRYARWADAAARHAGVAKARYETVEVAGDHMTSLAPAVADFRARILADLERCYDDRPGEVTRP